MAEAAIIDGKAFAANLRARIGRQVAALVARDGATPGLAALLVGDDPVSGLTGVSSSAGTVMARNSGCAASKTPRTTPSA